MSSRGLLLIFKIKSPAGNPKMFGRAPRPQVFHNHCIKVQHVQKWPEIILDGITVGRGGTDISDIGWSKNIRYRILA